VTNFSQLSLQGFLDALASDAPTPGGGTAAAIGGAMGASLAQMVAALTLSKEKYAASHEAVRPIAEAGFTVSVRPLALDAFMQVTIGSAYFPKVVDQLRYYTTDKVLFRFVRQP